MIKQDRTCLDGLQGEPKNGASEGLWPVMMFRVPIPIARGIRPVGTIRLPTMQVVHQSERASVVIVLQPRR